MRRSRRAVLAICPPGGAGGSSGLLLPLCRRAGFISASRFLLYERGMLHPRESKPPPAAPGCFCLKKRHRGLS